MVTLDINKTPNSKENFNTVIQENPGSPCDILESYCKAMIFIRKI